MAAQDSVDARSVTLDELLTRVQSKHAPVRIVRDGRAVAELHPVEAGNGHWRLPPIDERLRPIITPEYDPVAGVDEEDWPADLR